MNLVLADGYAKQIEGLLETVFGVVGKDLFTQCALVRGRLDPEIVKQIRYVADLHYKLANTPGYNLELDKAAFLSSCQQIITHLARIQSQIPLATLTDENSRQVQSQKEVVTVNDNNWHWRDLGSGLAVDIWSLYDSYFVCHEVPLVLIWGVIVGTIAAHHGMSYGFVAISVVGGAFLGLLSSIILKVFLFLAWLGTIVAVLVAVSMLLSKLF